MGLISHKEQILSDTNRMHSFEKSHNQLINFYDKKYLLDKSKIFDLYCHQLTNRIDISNDDFSEVNVCLIAAITLYLL